RPITLQCRIQKQLQLLQFQMSKFRLDPQFTARFRESLLGATVAHLKSLYVELIAPIRDLLNAHHLVLVPHGFLHNVPFHALHDGESYLMDRYQISYAPSASVFALCQTKPPTSSIGSLILGVPDTNTPSIRAEVDALARILPDAHLF